jgi:hypothetical protein
MSHIAYSITRFIDLKMVRIAVKNMILNYKNICGKKPTTGGYT